MKLPPAVFQDVINFHKKYGIQYDGPKRLLPKDLADFRDARLQEEIDELRWAIGEDDAEKMLDAIVDTIYIALGTCHLHGWDFDEAWRRVHAANMKKELAHKDNPGKYAHSADIVKPPGWKAPDLSDLI
jgi:predicted HAD superfamily Cof-like phosphohydrolase